MSSKHRIAFFCLRCSEVWRLRKLGCFHPTIRSSNPSDVCATYSLEFGGLSSAGGQECFNMFHAFHACIVITLELQLVQQQSARLQLHARQLDSAIRYPENAFAWCLCARVARESICLLRGSYPERSVLYSNKTQKQHQVWLRSCWDHGLTVPGWRLQKDHPPIRSNSTRVLQVAKAILDAAGAWAPLVQSLCILRGLSWTGKLVPLCSCSDGRHSNLSLKESVHHKILYLSKVSW